jgi:hypothetical protein
MGKKTLGWEKPLGGLWSWDWNRPFPLALELQNLDLQFWDSGPVCQNSCCLEKDSVFFKQPSFLGLVGNEQLKFLGREGVNEVTFILSIFITTTVC